MPGGATEPNAAMRLGLRLHHQRFGLIGLGEYRPALFVERLTGLGHPETSAGSLDQTQPEPLLEAGDAPTELGLVNVVSPGPTETIGLTDVFGGGDQAQGIKNYLATQIPAGRVGQPEEIAKAALFLGQIWVSPPSTKSAAP